MTFKKHWIHQGGLCAAIGILLVLFVIPTHLGAQKSWDNIPLLLTPPLQYVVPKAAAAITVDGRADEDSWSAAAWMNFTDIETGRAPERKKRARSKLLWDNNNLYVFAEFTAPDLWATIDRQDGSVFMDNAFEMFLNPDGTTFNYVEFQINALGTVWDLLLPRPYRNGGKPFSTWDIKGLKKAVHLAGTLNDPSDRDTSWGIELAIPLVALNVRNTSQLVNAVWRMNFSSVQWETTVVNGRYDKVKPEGNRFGIVHYDVWSPVGIIDLHYPERWGYVSFSDDSATSRKPASEEQVELELALWRYYYLQHMYREEKGEFASTLTTLDSVAIVKLPGLEAAKIAVEMFSNRNQFWLQGKLSGSAKRVAIDHEGEIHYNE